MNSPDIAKLRAALEPFAKIRYLCVDPSDPEILMMIPVIDLVNARVAMGYDAGVEAGMRRELDLWNERRAALKLAAKKAAIDYDHRIKQLMQDCGHPDSLSLYRAFKKLELEIRIDCGETSQPQEEGNKL